MFTKKPSTRDMLARLNELRAENDMQPLKTWKGSRVKLEEAIDAFHGDETPPAVDPEEAAEVIASIEKRQRRKAKKAQAKSNGKAKDDTPRFIVGKWARDHKLNPKVARARLRKAGLKAPYTLKQVEAVFSDA